MHPELVSSDAGRVIEIARSARGRGLESERRGWRWRLGNAAVRRKLNGAKRAMVAGIESENPEFVNIPVYLSRHGLRRSGSRKTEPGVKTLELQGDKKRPIVPGISKTVEGVRKRPRFSKSPMKCQGVTSTPALRLPLVRFCLRPVRWVKKRDVFSPAFLAGMIVLNCNQRAKLDCL